MVSRCDYYSDEEYQYACYLEEEYYLEEQAKESFYKSEHEAFFKAALDYKKGNISLEEALTIADKNALGYTREDFFKALEEYEDTTKGEIEER